MYAGRAPDNYDVAELIDIGITAVLIDKNHPPIRIVTVPRDVVIIAAMTARVGGPTSQNECSECQGCRY